MERIPDCRSCNAETAGAKRSADIWNGEQIGFYLTTQEHERNDEHG